MKPIITAVLSIIFCILLASCQITSETQLRLDAIADEYAELACLNDYYSSYFANTPCTANDISLKHTLNNNKLSNEDKKLVLDLLPLERNLIDARINIIRTYGVNDLSKYFGSRSEAIEAGDLTITLLEEFKEVKLSNLLSLYKQEISWGTFNKNLQEYAAVYESRLDEGITNIAERANASPQTSIVSSPARTYTPSSTTPNYNPPSESVYTTQSSPSQRPLGDYFGGVSETFRQQSEDLLSGESLTPITDKYRLNQMIQRDEERARVEQCRQRAIQPIGGC